MIAISVDVDWAPDEVIEDTLALLDQAGVCATIFATHATPLLRGLTGHEIGLHPNFLPHPLSSCEQVFDDLHAEYPAARGVRCHSYHQSSPLLQLFARRGMAYDSNVVMFGGRGIRPFRHWNGLTRLPVFW
ncbi:MAG TPA: hypothetical protein VFN38_16285, partial [Gemmatimonadaceae bacterium]|nr:hypothetical protein [Gemmatimonadaceae bacterium]